MGLDSVEIVMEVEKTFGIQIPDEEAERILTVGNFHDVVWNYVKQKNTTKCKSQSMFYKLRSSFNDSLQIPKYAFTTEASLNGLIPLKNRRNIYRVFSERHGIKFPNLILTKEAENVLIITGVIIILGGLVTAFILSTFFEWTSWIYVLPIVGILLTALISRLLNPYRTIIKPSMTRDFTEKVVALNYAALAKDQGVNRKEVELVINLIISDRSGLDLEEITPEKKIADDLGIN